MGICYCIWLYRRFLLQWQGSGKRYGKGRITGSLKRFGGVDRSGIISGSYKRQKEILKRHCSTAALHDCTGGGIEKSLKAIQELFKNGHETKDDYANALRAYQAYTDKIKSDQRDKAAAFSNDCNY